MNIIATLLRYVVEKPIALVYLRGPAFNGYGFWEGLSKADICSRFTNVDARHWARNEHMCDEIIDNKLHAIYTIFYVAIYVYVLARATHVVFRLATKKAKAMVI